MRIERFPGNHWRHLALGAAFICLVGLLASCGQSPVAAIATPTDTVEPTATATVAPTATVTATPKPTAVPTHTAPPAPVTISMGSGYTQTFSPASITIHVGTKVIWVNHSSLPHNVYATSGPWGSGAKSSTILPPNGSFSYTFTKAGTYKYYCSIHPAMTATIIVL